MNNHKIYADKGVQTGFVRCSSHSYLNNNAHAFAHLGTLCNDQVLDDSQSSEYSSSHFLQNSGAYTHPETSLLDEDFRYISDRPAIDILRASKYEQLGYGKPSNLSPVSNRIVSLPETSPPCRIAQEISGRLVSMPESLRLLPFPRGHPGHYSDCTDQFNMSSASDATSRSKTSNAEQIFLGGIPQTPSPPSSPDSVMIIENENQVPQTFLRPKSIADNHESEGWTPLAGSPPKPIPALHGPLSLPYARCPSGAEGTVIEGEDLTHMIWGLELNSSQATQAKGHSASVHAYKTFPHGVPSSRSLKQVGLTPCHDNMMQNIYDQDVIDLSRPEFQGPLSKYVSGRQQSQLLKIYTNPTGGGQPTGKETRNRKPNIYDFVRRDSPIQLYPSSFGHLQPETNSWNSGLGIDLWRECLGSSVVPTSDFASLPANTRKPPLLLGHPLESFDATRVYQTPRNPPVHDARILDNQHRPGIPTPPDTGSPRWSPRFSQSHLSMTSHDAHYDQIPNIHSTEIPRQHVARSTRESEFSSHKAQEYLGSAMSNYRSITVDSASINGEELQPSHYRSPNSTVDVSSMPKRSSGGTQPLARYCATQGQPYTSGPMPPSPVSPDLRRNFCQQQPRSIPLARLIQRRLSSVAEEEAYAEVDSQEIHELSPDSPPSQSSHGSDYLNPKVYVLKERKGEQLSQMRNALAETCSTILPADHTKHTYKPPGHPSRRPLLGARDTPQKTPDFSTTGKPGPSINRFGENKGSTIVTQKTNPKPKKTHRKKRFTKKQEVTRTSDKQT